MDYDAMQPIDEPQVKTIPPSDRVPNRRISQGQLGGYSARHSSAKRIGSFSSHTLAPSDPESDSERSSSEVRGPPTRRRIRSPSFGSSILPINSRRAAIEAAVLPRTPPRPRLTRNGRPIPTRVEAIRPQSRRPWDKAEVEALLKAISIHGSSWAVIEWQVQMGRYPIPGPHGLQESLRTKARTLKEQYLRYMDFPYLISLRMKRRTLANETWTERASLCRRNSIWWC